MLTSQRHASAPTGRRLKGWAFAALLAFLLGPLGGAGSARAADISPDVGSVRAAIENGTWCTYWLGFGLKRPVYLSNEYGIPLPIADWIDYADPDDVTGFARGLSGLAYLASFAGALFLQSPAGTAWFNSPSGQEWISSMMRPASWAVGGGIEYADACSRFGLDSYYIPGTDVCLKIGGYVRAEVNDYGRPQSIDQLRDYTVRAQLRYDAPSLGPGLWTKRSSAATAVQPGSTASGSPTGQGQTDVDATAKQDAAAILFALNVATVQTVLQLAFGYTGEYGGVPISLAPDWGALAVAAALLGVTTPAVSGSALNAMGVTLHVKANLAAIDETEVGPPVVSARVQLTPRTTPDLPEPDASNLNQVKNDLDVGSDRSPLGCRVVNGTCKLVIVDPRDLYDYGLVDFPYQVTGQPAAGAQNGAGRIRVSRGFAPGPDPDTSDSRFIRLGDDSVGRNYNLSLTMGVRAAYAFQYDTDDVAGFAPSLRSSLYKFGKEGVNFSVDTLHIGDATWARIGVETAYNAFGLSDDDFEDELAAELIYDEIGGFLKRLADAGAVIVIDPLRPDVCRIELPGPWVEDPEHATIREGGIPHAVVALSIDESQSLQ